MDKEQILVIDDDPGVVAVLEVILGAEGYEVLSANSSDRGIELLRDHTPDLIVLDMRMPGMSGVGFLNQITGSDGKLKYPVLVLTAYGKMLDFFKNVEIDGFMLKPMHVNELVAEVDRILSLKSSKRKSRPGMVKGKARTVLIAEDDAEASNRLALAFTQAGFKTDQTNNGSDAIGKAILSEPDALVIKVVLPSMNGNLVVSTLRTIPKTSRLPAILYDQHEILSSVKDALLKLGGITEFVSSNGPREILEAAARVFKRL